MSVYFTEVSDCWWGKVCLSVNVEIGCGKKLGGRVQG